MAEETIEGVAWESEEAVDESEDALDEAEYGAEDIGEATRRRQPKRYFRPGRGVQGITLRNQDGRVRNLPFPTKLATVQETNRGLASQELARRGLAERLDRLETRFRVQEKKDSSASGLVSLLLGGGLTAIGAIEVAKQAGGATLGGWASESTTQMAALVSVSQLATSGAKFAINGRYHRSGIGIAADVFSLAQILTFAFGSFNQPQEFNPVADRNAAVFAMANASNGTLFLTQDTGEVYQVVLGANNIRALRLVAA